MPDLRESFEYLQKAMRRESSDWEENVAQQQTQLAAKRERYAQEKAALQTEVADLRREVYALCTRYYDDSDIFV